MPETLLERKISLCKELMKIFDIIEPGYTRIRGNYNCITYLYIILYIINIYRSYVI